MKERVFLAGFRCGAVHPFSMKLQTLKGTSAEVFWHPVKRTRNGAVFKELSQSCEERRLSSCPSAWKNSVPARPVVGNLWARGQNEERIGMVADHIITNTFFFFYLCIINYNILPSTVPIFGRQNLLEIILKHFEIIVRNLKLVLPNKSLRVSVF